MSALGQKQTLEHVRAMSALPPKADILTQRITDLKKGLLRDVANNAVGYYLTHSLSSNRVEEKASSEESSPKIFLGACHVLLLA